MTRFLNLLKQDFKFQYRHGFYLVYGVITLIYIFLVRSIPEGYSERVLVSIIFSDPTFIGFFFIGAILYFEKEQRVFEAIMVTPATKGEYILSKGLSLTLLSLGIVVIMVFATYGSNINWGYLILGVTLTSFLFIFTGIVVAGMFNSITTYLVIGGLLLAPFSLPIINYLKLVSGWGWNIVPTTGSLRLLGAAFTREIGVLEVLYWSVYLIVLNVIMFKCAVRSK